MATRTKEDDRALAHLISDIEDHDRDDEQKAAALATLRTALQGYHATDIWLARMEMGDKLAQAAAEVLDLFTYSGAIGDMDAPVEVTDPRAEYAA